MTTLNIRIDEKIKAQAGKTLSGLGLDMSSAVKLFLHQVVTENGLPFTPTKNTAVIKANWDKQYKDGLKSNGFKTAAELHASFKLK